MPCSMPDIYKEDSVVQSYRNYYNGEIKFMDLRPYLGYKIISVKPLADNEIRIEYKKERK